MRGKKRSLSVSQRAQGSTAHTEQMLQLFQCAGEDVKPIHVNTSQEAAREIQYLTSQVADGLDWDKREAAMRRGMALVNGGALEFESFRRGLQNIGPSLAAAAKNFRSALVKRSCLFIAQLAREMGPGFDCVGEIIVPISIQLAHGTQIIADSCKYAILCISKNCQSKRVFRSLCELCAARGASTKAVGAEALSVIMMNWDVQFLSNVLAKYESLLSKLLSDASATTRMYAKQSAKAYMITFPRKSEAFFEKFDQRTLRAINDCNVGKSERVHVAEPVKKVKVCRSKNPVVNPENDILANPPRVFGLKQQDVEQKEYKVVENDRKLPLSTRRRVSQNFTQKQKINYKELKEDVVKSKNRVPNVHNNYENGDYISKIVVPKRQSSVQTRRKNNDESNFGVSDVFQKKKIINVERKKPIQLILGEEKQYLENLKHYINDDIKTEIASSMIYISRDLLSCVSNESTIISSNALQILKELLPIFSQHFKSLLTTLVQSLITQIELGNIRTSDTAQEILSNLHNLFDNDDLLLICLIIQPSITLLKFVQSLTIHGKLDIEKESTCNELLKLSFKCREVTNQIETRNIVRYVYESNQSSFYNILNSLKERKNNEFVNFIYLCIPTLKLQNKKIEVPLLDMNDPITWLKKVKGIYCNIKTNNEWREIRPKIYSELNKLLFEQKEIDKVISFLYAIFTNKGIDDYELILQGLFVSTKRISSKSIDTILNLILKKSGIKNLLSTLHPLICDCNNILDVTHVAIILQNKLISSISRESLQESLPSIVESLTQAFESKYIEIRKAVVFSFVELHFKLGPDVMKSYMSHLSKGQQNLISIYISRRKS